MTDLNRLDARRAVQDPMRDVDAGNSTPSTSSSITGTAAPRQAHDLFDALVLHAPLPPNKNLATFIAATSATSAGGNAERTQMVQARMDKFAASAGGPYKVDGQMVAARPHFVIVGGVDHDKTDQMKAIADAAHLGEAGGKVAAGRGTPEQVRRVTQALIDAGQLPSTPGSLSDRIREMQWQFGVGFDCAGYSQQAALAASGKSRAALFGTATITDALSLAQFHRVPVTAARPGDLLVLNPPPNDAFGHKTIVYANNVISPDDAQKRIAESGGHAARFGEGGPVHEYQLDSSWGSGGSNQPHGGYRRDTCLYNESTKMWAYRLTGSGAFEVGDRPYDHPIQGTYRPNADKS